MKWILSLFAITLLSGCAQAGPPAASAPSATPSTSGAPAPNAATVEHALAASGIQITGTLEAPAGFQGYVGSYQGHAMPVYVTPDGQHVVVGSLFDLQGHDLTSSALNRAIAGHGAEIWKRVQAAPTIVEGNPNAKRVVYAFMDTDCPFCHQFWQASQKWLKAGDVQMRIVLVAVISPDSMPRGAAVLDAADPAQAWATNEREFGPKRPPVTAQPSPRAMQTLEANNQLMSELGFQGTPTIIYKDAAGQVHALQGMPRDPSALDAIFAG